MSSTRSHTSNSESELGRRRSPFLLCTYVCMASLLRRHVHRLVSAFVCTTRDGLYLRLVPSPEPKAFRNHSLATGAPTSSTSTASIRTTWNTRNIYAVSLNDIVLSGLVRRNLLPALNGRRRTATHESSEVVKKHTRRGEASIGATF